MMADEGLFGELPDQSAPRTEAVPRGAPRLREPVRNQVELRAVDIDSLIGQDHLARVIWAYVEGLDLSELEDRVKARENRPGHPAPSPRLLLALWLYATSDGVGSARALDRLCDSHDVYRWLCGGVSLNYHTLSDFRVGCADLLDRLLVEHLVALNEAGLIDLEKLTQDGVRIRANAGAGSFRREATLDRQMAQAKAVVEELKREVDADPEASSRRIRAARERAARERSERVQAAQRALDEIKRKRKQLDEKGGNGKKPKEPRASTTDPQARVMKMADAGFRPAYNVQVASAAGELIVVTVDIDNNGSDRGLMRPMLERTRTRLKRLPRRYLADGGFCSGEDIEWAHGEGVEVYCPPPNSRSGVDPFLPRSSDGPGVAAWRARMASEAGKAQYKARTICECIHARWRNWDLRQLTVRGIEKVRAVVLWYALTNNILQGHQLAKA
jgi:transposase